MSVRFASALLIGFICTATCAREPGPFIPVDGVRLHKRPSKNSHLIRLFQAGERIQPLGPGEYTRPHVGGWTMIRLVGRDYVGWTRSILIDIPPDYYSLKRVVPSPSGTMEMRVYRPRRNGVFRPGTGNGTAYSPDSGFSAIVRDAAVLDVSYSHHNACEMWLDDDHYICRNYMDAKQTYYMAVHAETGRIAAVEDTWFGIHGGWCRTRAQRRCTTLNREIERMLRSLHGRVTGEVPDSLPDRYRSLFLK